MSRKVRNARGIAEKWADVVLQNAREKDMTPKHGNYRMKNLPHLRRVKHGSGKIPTVVKKDDFSNQPLLDHLAMTPPQQ